MIYRCFLLMLFTAILGLTLAGCGGDGSSFSVEPGIIDNRDGGVTNALGEAYLRNGFNSSTVSVRDSATDLPISEIQLVGIFSSGGEGLYIAADPQQDYHPVISSGKYVGEDTTRLYLPRVDRNTWTNATSYCDVYGGLLYDTAQEYHETSFDTTIADLRDDLAELAHGRSSGMVLCATQPLNSYVDRIPVTEIAQRSSDLSVAFQSIGWQYLFTSRGFTPTQHLKVWVIDPYELGITSSRSGTLYDTLLVVVAPVTPATGTVEAGSLRVELSWDEPVDLDLHLIRNNADLYDSYDDCYWKNMEQTWGSLEAQWPRLISDSFDGSDPETIVLDEMNSDDTYSVVVDYWGDPEGRDITHSVTPTVRVWTQGNSEPREFRVLGLSEGSPGAGDDKWVCDINGATGDITMNTRALSKTGTRSPKTSPGLKTHR